ncbi:MAG: hypothetical protein AB7S56_08500 [Halothiobacillaceae bacterium]
MSLLVLCLRHKQLLAVLRTREGQGLNLPINGEWNWVPIKHAASLKAALEDVRQRLELPPQSALDVGLVYDHASAELLQGFSQWRGDPHWQWQWLRWELRLPRLSPIFAGEQPPAPERVLDELVPDIAPCLLGMSDDAAAPVVQHDDTDWRQSVAELEKTNQTLRARLDMMQPLETEKLLSYLPALYLHVFSVIGAADLALLAGRVEPLAIPSPYPEPSAETLHRKQREFRLLSKEEQARIVRLVSVHHHRLQPRAEMQTLMSELMQDHP